MLSLTAVKVGSAPTTPLPSAVVYASSAVIVALIDSGSYKFSLPSLTLIFKVKSK